MRVLALTVLGLLASGCIHGPQVKAPLVTAADVFLYAQLAQNAYRKPGNKFKLENSIMHVGSYPDRSVKPEALKAITGSEANDIFGLGFEIYEHHRPDKLTDTIFVFRGTEGGLDLNSCDFRFGNRRTIQHRLATELVGRHLAKHNIPASRAVFVGHSLGGGLARHVSMRYQGGRVYAFDSSPVFKAPDGYRPEQDPTLRYSVNATGEVLKLTRIFGPEPTQIYWKIPCNIRGDMIDKHSMRALATCLTLRAADQEEPPTTAFPAGREMARASIPLNSWTFGTTPAADVDTEDYACPR